MAHGFEILYSLFVIRRVAEVLPVAVVGVANHFFTGSQELFDEVGEVEVLALGNIFQHPRLEDVQPHANSVIDGWFFDVILHLAAIVHFNNTKINFDSALVHSNGADATILFVELDEIINGEKG